jgi:hypothetical protein
LETNDMNKWHLGASRPVACDCFLKTYSW